ncbi:MAG: GTP-binding protein [Promethearchaeota archaeon]
MSGRYFIKTLLIGDGAVGKTTLRRRYMGERLDSNYIMTIGADFSVKRENIEGFGSEITYQIWDVAGQPRFGQIRSGFYKGARGALLVFDLTRPDTFNNAGRWLNELQGALKQVIPFLLIGNKLDIRNQAPTSITTEQGKRYAEKLSQITDRFGFEVEYYETSALTGENVNTAFLGLGKKILEQ